MSSKILDRNGKLIQTKQLTEETASPSLTGLRKVWNDDSVANGLTPAKLASIFESANHGDHADYLTLAAEMEEREPHYGSVLGTRKRAVAGLEIQVNAADDDKKSLELAEAVRGLTKAPAFGDLLDGLLDGLGKGYSVCEIDWLQDKQWLPKKYIWRDPRFFTFAQDDDQTLRLLDEADIINGVELPAFKFIIHRPKLKSGIVTRGGLARLSAVSYMCKSYTLTDWMAFIEVFGMPIRIGKYGNEAGEDDLKKLRSAVANIGSSAAAIMPESMQIEFTEAAKSRGGESLFQNLAEWLDKQISKAVLGQTMTADDGSSQSQANVHNDVRIDILRADAKALANTLNRDLVKPFIDLNFGVQEVYPAISLSVPEAENLSLLADSLAKLVPLGLKVDQNEVRNKLGLTEPKDDATLLKPAFDSNQNEQHEQNKSALNQMNDCQHCSTHKKSINSEQDEYEPLADWQEVIEPVINPVQDLINDCQDYVEFQARLPELLQTMDATEFLNSLTLATFKARAEVAAE